MTSLQDQYDDAMFDFSMGDFGSAAAKLRSVLEQDPAYFEARLALGMAYCRLGDLTAAIAEGHKAEQLRPQDQHVHTNLSLFYVKAGDKARAEHHGLQSRVASWRGNMAPPKPKGEVDQALEMAKAKPESAPAELKLSDKPWKKQSP